jgi:hypothetical protein
MWDVRKTKNKKKIKKPSGTKNKKNVNTLGAHGFTTIAKVDLHMCLEGALLISEHQDDLCGLFLQ